MTKLRQYNSSVQILPIPTPRLKAGDNLAAILAEAITIKEGDIVVISSKAIATVEGSVVNLKSLKASKEAESLAKSTGEEDASPFYEAVIEECKRLNGRIISSCPGAVLTAVRPKGLPSGSILTANAGLDRSNVEEGYAIGWPGDVAASVKRIRSDIEQRLFVSSFSYQTKNEKRVTKNCIAVIISDSCCRPMRLGVTAIALAASGIDPLSSQKGMNDLFGKPLRITTEAIADQLATAANALMGNAAQSTPAAVIRDHGLPFSNFEGWVPGIEVEEDLYGSM